jgi:hypothetical protein
MTLSEIMKKMDGLQEPAGRRLCDFDSRQDERFAVVSRCGVLNIILISSSSYIAQL